jgi:hypothetical protein
MTRKTITLELRPADAEPILRDAARDAAMFGALGDYMTKRTMSAPIGFGEPLADARARWAERFLRGKRIVEAFGVDYEPTSEAETLTVHWPDKNEKREPVNVAGMRFTRVSGGVPDPKNAIPQYRREIHAEACRQAADRVVRRWRELIEGAA